MKNKFFCLIVLILILIHQNLNSMNKSLNIKFTNYIELEVAPRGIKYYNSVLFLNSVYVLYSIYDQSGNMYLRLYKIESNGSYEKIEINPKCDREIGANIIVENNNLIVVYKSNCNSKEIIYEQTTIDYNFNREHQIIDKLTFERLISISSNSNLSLNVQALKEFNDETMELKNDIVIDEQHSALILLKSNSGYVEIPPYLINSKPGTNIMVGIYSKTNTPLLYIRNIKDLELNKITISSRKNLYLEIEYSSLNIDDLTNTELLISSDTLFTEGNCLKLKYENCDEKYMQFLLSDSIPDGTYYFKLNNSKFPNQLNNFNLVEIKNHLYKDYLVRKELEKQNDDQRRKMIIYGLQFLAFLLLFIWTHLVFNNEKYAQFYFVAELNPNTKKIIESVLYLFVGVGALGKILFDLIKTWLSK